MTGFLITVLIALLAGLFYVFYDGSVLQASRNPDKYTVIDVRTAKTPVKHDVAVVQYDAWGDPYVDFGITGSYPLCGTMKVLEDGRIQESYHNTEWRIRSGPAITWPDNSGRKAFDGF